MDLQESTLYDLDLGVKVTQNVALYHPHHMTYASANFEVAMSNGSREGQGHMKCCLVSSTSCDLCTGKI